MRVLGLMSGTSVDGLDAALADFELAGNTLRLQRVGETTLRFPDQLRTRVQDVLTPRATSAADICVLHRDLGVAFAEQAAAALTHFGAGRPDLVASHGQTVHHEVDDRGQVLGTLQLGQPAELAERLGVPIIADFRVRDVAAGGQGAPLVGLMDELLLRGADRPGALLNLGGIANITFAGGPDRPALAFDVGPANALLDAALTAATGLPYDEGGRRTAAGSADPDLLAVLLADPYLARTPPKSTGKERYHADYLDRALAAAPVRELDDVLATLAEAVACAVVAEVRRFGAERVWASGGGIHNAGLMAALRRRLADAGAELDDSAALGLPPDHKEAYAFALLGWLTWHGLPGSVPSITGAAGPRVLGTIVPGSEALRLPAAPPEPPRRLVVTGFS